MALLTFTHMTWPAVYLGNVDTFISLQAVRSCWLDPVPSRPDSGTTAGDSCSSSSEDATDSPHLKMSFRSMYPALHRPQYPLPECRCSSCEVPKYPSVEATRANKIQLTKYMPTRTRMQRRPSRFSMSCPILPQHQSPPLPSFSNVTPRDCTSPRLGPFVSRFYQSTILFSRVLFAIH